jgi:hypothetical protein
MSFFGFVCVCVGGLTAMTAVIFLVQVVLGRPFITFPVVQAAAAERSVPLFRVESAIGALVFSAVTLVAAGVVVSHRVMWVILIMAPLGRLAIKVVRKQFPSGPSR